MGTKTALKKAPASDVDQISSDGHSLADALFTITQQRLLGLLFGQPRRSFFVTELIELADVGRGAVQRELSRLERGGLVSTKKHGNQKHYQANAKSPLYKELCSIVRKTIGLQELIAKALEPLNDKIVVALIYGSIAKGTDSAASDIDLLVVSDDLTLEELYSTIAITEKKLGRNVSLTMYTAGEFRDRRNREGGFLKRVLDGPTTLLKGSLDAL